jgi:integral membrane protein
MLSTPLGRLRLTGLTEGVSYLLLLLVAMPMKYLADVPAAVTVVGWAHGVLFIALCVAIAAAMWQSGLSWRLGLLAFVAALLPFGPFVIDGRLRREEQTRTQRAAEAAGVGGPRVAADAASAPLAEGRVRAT